jgi:hypothetical protein
MVTTLKRYPPAPRLRRGWEATEKAGWIARVNARNSNIFGNDRAGSDDHLITDRDWEDSGICSDTHTIAKFGWSPELRFSGRATGDERIINKHRSMRNEAVVPDRDQIADEGVGLNPAPLSDGCSLLYLNERSDESFIADVTTIQVCRFYDGHICAELHVDEADRTSLGWIHTAGL